MEAYTDFAYLYDTFMEEVPYEAWADLLSGLLKEHGINEGSSILDLGCGTGVFTRLMSDRGYLMTGVDLSEDMLSVAMDGNYSSDEASEEPIYDILYINQDMAKLSMPYTFNAVVSTCDSINYLTDTSQLVSCLKGVKSCLDEGGVFIFDFNTAYKYETVIGDSTIAESREDCAFIWENTYDPENRLNEYFVTFFVKDEDSELFSRFTETHIQRGYTIKEVEEAVLEAGFKTCKMLDEDGFSAVTSKSERVYVICE